MLRIAKFEPISKETLAESLLTTDGRMPEAILPTRATAGSAGYDFKALYDFTIEPGSNNIIATGIKCRMEDGWVLQIYPRSSLGFIYRVQLANTVGIIDADYYNNEKNEGHIMIKLEVPEGFPTLVVKRGEAFAQGVFVPFGITMDDEATAKRDGGMGSTNKKK